MSVIQSIVTAITQPGLSPEQKAFFDQIEASSEHFFVTGKAGTGKSHLLQYLKNHSKKNLVVAAPTGVAAIVVGGQTIHSLFKLPPALLDQNSFPIDARTRKLLSVVELVIIDEISMVRADLMDAIDTVMRISKKSRLPFGGAQVVMFGDPYQLPPIVIDQAHIDYFKENYGGAYFFHANVWKKTDFVTLELGTIFRQKDTELVELLNAIRAGKATDEQLQYLNRRVGLSEEDERVLTLATTNRRAMQINEYFLGQLQGKTYSYQAKVTGKIDPRAYPAEEMLVLKAGAQVMMLKNDSEKRWVNGSIGKVVSLTDTEIVVIIDGMEYEVKKDIWNRIRFIVNKESGKIEEEVISTFMQAPLRLAWAVTIHKSQGQTFDRVNIDLERGAFAHGQTYVALSRCKTLGGISLVRAVESRDIIVDQEVVTFMENVLS
ncbi:AAA family ATPase [Candidatus Woesebacteria bacterium]|nr:AAA family ATPase [Candidatus Woesebacteria bacterium]